MPLRNKDYYKILQVDPSADQEVIEAAYKRLARMYHPDVNKSPDATLRMQEINAAYEVLNNRAKRAHYDRERSVHSSGSDTKYEEERRKRAEAEAAQRRAQEEAQTARRRAQEEQRKREDTEAAWYRAKEERRKREAPEDPQRHTQEEQQRKEQSKTASRRTKRAWYWIIGVIGAESLLHPLLPLDLSTKVVIQIYNVLILIPLITLYIAYRYPIAWGWAAISVIVLHVLNYLFDFLRYGLYSDLIFLFIFIIGNAVAVSIVAFLRLRRLSRVNTSQGTIPSGND